MPRSCRQCVWCTSGDGAPSECMAPLPAWLVEYFAGSTPDSHVYTDGKEGDHGDVCAMFKPRDETPRGGLVNCLFCGGADDWGELTFKTNRRQR